MSFHVWFLPLNAVSPRFVLVDVPWCGYSMAWMDLILVTSVDGYLGCFHLGLLGTVLQLCFCVWLLYLRVGFIIWVCWFSRCFLCGQLGGSDGWGDCVLVIL